MARKIFFSFISIFTLNAQDIEPVEWEYDVVKINDTEYNQLLQTTINDLLDGNEDDYQIETTITKQENRTKDLGGSAKTNECGDSIMKSI